MTKHDFSKIFLKTLSILVLFASIASFITYYAYNYQNYGGGVFYWKIAVFVLVIIIFLYSLLYSLIIKNIYSSSLKYIVAYNSVLGALIVIASILLVSGYSINIFFIDFFLYFLLLQFIISSFLSLREHYKKNKTLLWAVDQNHYFFKTFIETLIILIFSSSIAVIVRYNFDENVRLFWPFTLLIYSILALIYTAIYSSILNRLAKFSFKYIGIYNAVLSLFLIVSPIILKKNYYEISYIYYSWFLIFLIIQLFICYRFRNPLKH